MTATCRRPTIRCRRRPEHVRHDHLPAPDRCRREHRLREPSLAGYVLWPGAVVDGLGHPVDWPGSTWDGSTLGRRRQIGLGRPSVKVRLEGNVSAGAEVRVAYRLSPNCSANPPGDVLAEASGPNTPHHPTLPPTDTLGSTQTTTGSSWGLVLLLMASLSAGILFLSPARILARAAATDLASAGHRPTPHQ